MGGVMLKHKRNIVFMLQVFLATNCCGMLHFVSGSADIIHSSATASWSHVHGLGCSVMGSTYALCSLE